MDEKEIGLLIFVLLVPLFVIGGYYLRKRIDKITYDFVDKKDHDAVRKQADTTAWRNEELIQTSDGLKRENENLKSEIARLKAEIEILKACTFRP